jgi:predicted amidohydrolase YtcJ
LYAAVARRDTSHKPENGWHAEQSISIGEVFAGYTRGAAVAAGAARSQGTLAPDAFADFAVWKQDPLLCAGAELLELEIAATIVGGEVVWQD